MLFRDSWNFNEWSKLSPVVWPRRWEVTFEQSFRNGIINLLGLPSSLPNSHILALVHSNNLKKNSDYEFMAIITFFIFLYLLQINLQWYNLFRFSEIYVSLSKRVQENIITIGELSETHRRPIRDPLETHRRPTFLIGNPLETVIPDRRPIRDRHAWSETHRRPTCLIGDTSKTDMPDQRPLEDWHASSETHRRPTCLIGGRHASSGTDPRQDMYLLWVSDEACRSPMRDGTSVSNGSPLWHVGLQLGKLVSNLACRSPMGFRWGMFVSDEACQSPMGLRSGMSVSDGSPKYLR